MSQSRATRTKAIIPAKTTAPNRLDTRSDPWGMSICKCVSYTARKVEQTYSYMSNWGGQGNANQWLSNAHMTGYTITSTPKIDTVGIMTDSYYGHSVWIESISTDGSMVYFSRYNAPNTATNYAFGE